MASDIKLPPGRLVYGSLYAPQTKDAEGKPLTIKSGANVGQPTQRYSFGIAIPKGPERHWSETTWGAVIWREGHSRVQGSTLGEHFAWKVKDGDSKQPGRPVNGKPTAAPSEREGYPGHWVISLSSSYAPKCYSLVPGPDLVALPQPDAINPGDYIEVTGNVADNGSSQNPGVYINHGMVCLRGYGARIMTGGQDPAAAGFGQAPIPQGASMVPLAGTAPMPAPAPAAPAAYSPPPAPGGFAPPPAPVGAPLPPPNPAVLAVPPPPAAPAAPAAPVARAMLPTATATYDQYRASGWTDAQLVQAGLMAP